MRAGGIHGCEKHKGCCIMKKESKDEGRITWLGKIF